MASRPIAVLLALLLLCLSACAPSFDERLLEGEREHRTDAPFYTPPMPIPTGRPGEIVRSEAIGNAPSGTKAWRVIYHSTDTFGADVLVSGLVAAPAAPPTGGDRIVLSWAHPTTGTAASCAPSIGVDPFILIEGLDEFIKRGYVVAASDYPGMGLPGPSSYLIGEATGNSVLDIARAARNLDDAHAGKRVLLWGHSQGGQAAVFAAQSAGAYAPDLDVIATAVAAPAVDLTGLFAADIGDLSGVTIGAYAFDAYVQIYGTRDADVRLAGILTPEAAATVPKMVGLCLIGQNKQIHALAAPLVGKFVTADPTTTEPWAGLLTENSAGSQRIPMPLFVAQGLADDLVHPEITAEFVRKECAVGTRVRSLTIPDVGHGEIALHSLPTLLPWLDAVVDGGVPPTDC